MTEAPHDRLHALQCALAQYRLDDALAALGQMQAAASSRRLTLTACLNDKSEPAARTCFNTARLLRRMTGRWPSNR